LSLTKLAAEEVDEKSILQSKLNEINTKLERQKTRLKNVEISYSLYLEFVADFENERREIEEELAKPSKGVSTSEKCIDFAITFSMKLAPLWSSAKYSDQQRLHFLVFPEGIFYNREINRCRTIIDLEQVIAEKKNGTAPKNLGCAASVEVRGIEPLSKHIRQKLSTCLYRN